MRKYFISMVLLAVIAVVTLSCSTKSSSPAETLFQQADELLQVQEYEAAIQIYQSICDQYPGTFDEPLAEEMIAVCYSCWADRLVYVDNDYATAIENLQVVVGQYPGTDTAGMVVDEDRIPEFYIRWAGYLTSEDEYQSALEKYQFVVSQYPQSADQVIELLPWCYYGWGYHLYIMERYDEAIEKYEILVAEFPESECVSQLRDGEGLLRCYYELAGQQEEAGNIDVAIEYYEAILQMWPGSFYSNSVEEKLPCLYLAGATQYEDEGQWGAACEIYEQILSRFPDSQEAFNARFTLLPQCSYEYARTLQSERKYQEAIESYEASRLKEAEGALPECYYLWTQQLLGQQQYDDALGKYSIIISDYSDTDWASWEKGEILSSVPAENLYYYAGELDVSESALRLYQTILDYHSQSDYAISAEEAMVDIGIALIMAEDHGDIPPAISEGAIVAGGAAAIEVRNGTPYTLLILFKGPVAKAIYLRPDPDAQEYIFQLYGGITEYTEETINLIPGTYQIGARVSDTSIAPWYGTDTFQANQQYLEVFWIRVTFG